MRDGLPALLAKGLAGLPDGLYRLRLAQVVVLPGGRALERYELVEAPGVIYEESHAIADDTD